MPEFEQKFVNYLIFLLFHNYIFFLYKTVQLQNALLNDSDYLEKFARENYLMKRDDEDIFIIVGAEFLLDYLGRKSNRELEFQEISSQTIRGDQRKN